MKVPPFRLTWHSISQTCLILVQFGNFAAAQTGILPPKFMPYILVTVAFAQFVLGQIAHYQQPPENPPKQ